MFGIGKDLVPGGEAHYIGVPVRGFSGEGRPPHRHHPRSRSTQGCLNTANSDVCSDDSACTESDACANGTCAGTAIPCKDGNACTDDACDPKTGCTFTANAAPCSDGNACTDPDACKSGSCVAGAALDCNDNNPCTTDNCDTVKGCVFTENSLACDASNACTTQDACKTGKCIGGAPLNCNDLNTCTADACDPAKGCVNAAVTDGSSCADGLCTALSLQPASTCQAGKCVTPALQDCNDQSVCTVDTCAKTGCLNEAANEGFPCGPNAFCTKGTCQTCALYSKAVSTLAGSELRGIAAWGKGVVVAGRVPTNQNGDNGLLMAIKEDGSIGWSASRGGNNDDGFRAIAPAGNGDYFAAGYSDIGGSQQGWITRIAGATGAQLWTQSLGGGGNNDWFSGLVPTADGGVVVVGWTQVNNAGENGWVVKYSATGTVAWNRTNLGGAQNDRLYGIVELATGGFVAVGSTSSQSSGGRDGWSLRLAPDGTVWGETRYGGSQNDDLFGLVLLSDGSTVAAGYSASPGGLGQGDGWVVRMALNGTATWQQRLGTNWGQDALYGISVAGNGELVAAGYRAAIGGAQDWLVRLQAATGQGVATPFNQALSGASGNTGLYAVRVLADETIAAVGRYNDQGWAIRASAAGSTLCGN